MGGSGAGGREARPRLLTAARQLSNAGSARLTGRVELRRAASILRVDACGYHPSPPPTPPHPRERESTPPHPQPSPGCNAEALYPFDAGLRQLAVAATEVRQCLTPPAGRLETQASAFNGALAGATVEVVLVSLRTFCCSMGAKQSCPKPSEDSKEHRTFDLLVPSGVSEGGPELCSIDLSLPKAQSPARTWRGARVLPRLGLAYSGQALTQSHSRP